MSEFTAVVNQGTKVVATEVKFNESVTITIPYVATEVKFDESVTITIPYESAVQLQYLLGHIGGAHTTGPFSRQGFSRQGFRPETQEPLYSALQRAGVNQPNTGWESTDEDEAADKALRDKFTGLYCELFT